VSDLLPGEGDRTFAFSGVVKDGDFIDQKSEVQQRKPNATECVGRQKGAMVVTTITSTPLQ
jgi:hypothetical protein